MPSYKSQGIRGEFAFLKNSGQAIRFEHLPSGEKAAFLGAVTTFQDVYTSTWHEEPVYGRMDPISTFQRTGRKITLGWSILNESVKIGRENMTELTKLINFLYPSYYTSEAGASTISTGPVLKLTYSNLAASVSPKGSGLIGYLAGFTFNPVMDAGFVVTCGGQNPESIPKQIDAQCEFTVLHSHQLGWYKSAPRTAKFPYGYGKAISGQDLAQEDAKRADAKLQEEKARVAAALEKFSPQAEATAQQLLDSYHNPNQSREPRKFSSGGDPTSD